MQRIVVGVDGSAASKAALHWAMEMAGRIGARLEVIRAWHYPPPYHEWDARPSSYGFLPLLPDRDRAEQVARDELTATTVEVLGAQPSVQFDERVIKGHAADVLIEASTDAALLVVGRHGHNRLQALLLGSVARTCTERACCPVVVIPAPGDEPASRQRVPTAIKATDATSKIVGHPIVVGVDGSVSALHAVRWAAEEAALRRVALRLVHSVPLSAARHVGSFETLEVQGRQYVTQAQDRVRQIYPEVSVDVEVHGGDPVPVLVDLSEHARLVVVGSRGLGEFGGILTGSTAVALAKHGHCPIAVIRGPVPEQAAARQGPVVVGVDGSPTSEAAVALAFEEASLRNLDLVAVHTWIDFSSDYSYAYARQFVTDWDEIETEERELLAQRLAGWQEKYPDVMVKRVVAPDRPVRHLLEQAANAQLLVVGSRGHGALAGTLLGSTSQALIHRTPCPLLIARPII
ncbi:MAG TPA: universal stress protein [Pseudonocardiaceae bacterium]|nr:universal stress protein [Pseudonocardiaceae bacterium]